MKYSIIVPVYNESENIAPLHREITETMNSIGEPYEIIFIDDGSDDNTVEVMRTLSPLTIIQMRKNFGQTAAMDAAFKHAAGEFFITLDGDGQNPPSEIPKLIEVQKQGDFDIVSGWRKHRQDPFFKRIVSRGAYRMRNLLVKDHIHDSGCSLKIYRRECFEDVDLFGEMHRFIPAVLGWSGFTVGEAVVEHRARRHGTTKYNWKRVVKGFIDMLAVWFWRRYSARPLHLFGGLGMILIFCGVALAAFLAVRWFFLAQGLANSNLPLVAVLCVVLGVQFFVSGILADIGIRTYHRKKHMPYSIKRISKTSAPDDAS
ncbi:MAG: glycosyltransferase family 2 protein [Candidatus Kerfeldbacteria bacterium]